MGRSLEILWQDANVAINTDTVRVALVTFFMLNGPIGRKCLHLVLHACNEQAR